MSVTFTRTVAPLTAITLRNPQLGDSVGLNVKTKFNMAMDGTVYSYLNTPASRKFVLHFTEIITATMLSVMSFFRGAAGQKLVYTDYDGANHNVIVLADTLERVARAINICHSDYPSFRESHDFSIELEEVS